MINPIKFEKYKYPIILGLLSQLILILISFVTLKSMGNEDSTEVLLFSPIILNIMILVLFKIKKGNELKWFDFNVVSFVNSFISSIVIINLEIFAYDLDENEWIVFIISFLISIIPSVIVGIFLEKGPIGLKIKRLLSVILFVWAIYKLFTSFSNSEESESKNIGLDKDGDGVMDTSFIDTDGDGISDTISKDSDGDGLVDTVYSDTNGDGKIDSFIKDSDGDGISDFGIIDSDGDGKTDKLV